MEEIIPSFSFSDLEKMKVGRRPTYIVGLAKCRTLRTLDSSRLTRRQGRTTTTTTTRERVIGLDGYTHFDPRKAFDVLYEENEVDFECLDCEHETGDHRSQQDRAKGYLKLIEALQIPSYGMNSPQQVLYGTYQCDPSPFRKLIYLYSINENSTTTHS